MLMSMLLSQELDFDGDVEEYVATVAKHRRLTHVSFGDFVDLYNGLVDRVKLQNCVRSPLAGSSEAGTSAAAAPPPPPPPRRRGVERVPPRSPQFPFDRNGAAATSTPPQIVKG